MAETGTTTSRPRRLGRLALWGLLGLALAWAALSWTASQVVRPGVGLPAHFGSPMRLSGTPVHVRLAGEDYCIPVNYLDAPLDPGVDQTHLLLQALLPDLQPRNPETADEMRRTRGWGRKIGMLVTAAGDPAEVIARRYEIIQSMFGPVLPVGNWFRLEVSNSSPESQFGRLEIYQLPSNDLSVGFIRCDLLGDVQSPSCRHEFIVSDRFVVAASYGRAFLSEWDGIAGRIEDLFEDFRTNDACYAGLSN